jgi:hypothetical protein
MKGDLANIKLKSWPYAHSLICHFDAHENDQRRLPQEAVVFIRGPKNSDINTLTEIVSSSKQNSLPLCLTVYKRKKRKMDLPLTRILPL